MQRHNFLTCCSIMVSTAKTRLFYILPNSINRV